MSAEKKHIIFKSSTSEVCAAAAFCIIHFKYFCNWTKCNTNLIVEN